MSPFPARQAFGAAIGCVVLVVLGGCLNWQASYDEAARRQCRALPDASERRACLDRASNNSRQQRDHQRGE